jgi:hypothetical protein
MTTLAAAEIAAESIFSRNRMPLPRNLGRKSVYSEYFDRVAAETRQSSDFAAAAVGTVTFIGDARSAGQASRISPAHP